MAASKATPVSTTGTLSPMDPTSTEHDFRFPRRPPPHDAGAAAPAATPASSNESPGNLCANLEDLGLGLPTAHGAAAASNPNDLLRSSAFPPFQEREAAANQTPEELQKQDPLGTQVWRLFNKMKQQMPNQERMENFTWRMMHVNLRKSQQEEAAR